MKTKVLPFLPLRDVVVYPQMVIPLFIGRDKSVQALDEAMNRDKQILLLTQHSPGDDEPGEAALYRVGTVATILQMLKLQNGTLKVLVEGGQRAEALHFADLTSNYQAEVALLDEEELEEPTTQEAFVRSLRDQFEQYAEQGRKVPREILASLHGIDEPGRLIDAMAAHMPLKIEQKQKVLEITDIARRARHFLGLLEAEIELLQVEQHIRGHVKKQMERNHREYYLNEQMKAIQKELGNGEDGHNEVDALQKRIEQAALSQEAKKRAETELRKLRQMPPMSAEATVVRTYLDWLVGLPWQAQSRVRHDLPRAEAILEAEHYGLKEVKERILEYLAVQKRVKVAKGPVLCLVGPPGVGKTSLAESIARATNRKFVRMALGGVRDEAEIRGHRRTYIGSMPGRLLQKMTKAGVRNPLFLLDEIDKMGQDMRGDPASALLEVLDPEQNHSFNDHYLEVDYDLSGVMFLCTANSMNIPPALLDRMEIIRLPGYTEDEKQNIALKYLLPKQLKESGLKKSELTLEPEAVLAIIRHYTREAGVRGLERQIAKLCRKVVRKYAGEKRLKLTLSAADLEPLLGVRKYRYGLAEQDNQIGQVNGLAWTEVGGELLRIEAAAVPGKGQLIKTGSLGDVMGESITAALTVVRSRAQSLGLAADFQEKNDIHIHVPEGATPKDGPSAGIGMCTALVSVLTQTSVRADVAMTGEITLRGQVLAIGGLKEKLLAAHRGGIKTVIIPEENQRDLKEIPENIQQNLQIKAVKWIDEVLQIALQYAPQPLPCTTGKFTENNPEQKGDAQGRRQISTH